MKMRNIFYLIIFLACAFSCTHGTEKKSSPEMDMVRKSCQYLWNLQAEDGGWHSIKHGLMKDGQSLSPYILNALMEIPDSIFPKPKEKIEKALQFIRSKTNQEGVLGLADPIVLEYPNYATAYALMVLLKYGNESDKALIDKMVLYLAAQQFTEKRGIQPEHLSYGSWGFGETNLPKGETGHSDLSNTRRVLQALRWAKYEDQEVYDKAKKYLNILQKHPTEKRNQPLIDTLKKNKKVPYDGGFYYSSVLLSANKAHQEPESKEYQAFFRSYATATCDGLLSRLATGESKDSEPVQAALQWLLRYDDLNYPEGIPQDEENGWNLVMVFYHVAVRSEVYAQMQPKNEWRKEMLAFLMKRQQEDGSFSNPNGARNKEDDPLLATAFAVLIAGNVLR